MNDCGVVIAVMVVAQPNDNAMMMVMVVVMSATHPYIDLSHLHPLCFCESGVIGLERRYGIGNRIE
jgi:hypothetical protein